MLEIDGHRLTQSLAIINYLDIRYPNQPLIPAVGRRARARRRDGDGDRLRHPSAQQSARAQISQERARPFAGGGRRAGMRTGSAKGCPRSRRWRRRSAGKFLFGDAPTGADVCLVPQLYNARRFNVPLDDYPTLLRAEENANKLEAFAAAHPDRQEVPA